MKKQHIEVSGSDVTEIIPHNGIIHLRGIVKNPTDKIFIRWEVDNSSGCTVCEAWRGQYEIDCLSKAGYIIKGVKLA